MPKSFWTDLRSDRSSRLIYAQQRRFSIATCCVIWLLCAFSASAAHGQTGPQVVPPPPTPQLGPMTQEQLEMAARFEECRRKLQDDRTGGPITALRFGSTAIEIDVDGAQWKAMSFDDKLALVQNISCYAVAGNPRLNARVQVLDHLDQRKLAYYDGAVLKLQ